MLVAYLSYRVVEMPGMIYGRTLAERVVRRRQARFAIVTHASWSA
jgi:hypothetical protein